MVNLTVFTLSPVEAAASDCAWATTPSNIFAGPPPPLGGPTTARPDPPPLPAYTGYYEFRSFLK